MRTAVHDPFTIGEMVSGAGGRWPRDECDFCQALGVPSEIKYQSKGGPSLADCFAVHQHADEHH